MSEPKFTRLPYERSGTSIYALEHRGDYAKGKPVLVNRFHASVQSAGRGSAGQEECEAVAALFAASPDLYYALEQLLDDMGEDGLCVCPAAKEQAIAALKKARGEL